MSHRDPIARMRPEDFSFLFQNVEGKWSLVPDYAGPIEKLRSVLKTVEKSHANGTLSKTKYDDFVTAIETVEGEMESWSRQLYHELLKPSNWNLEKWNKIGRTNHKPRITLSAVLGGNYATGLYIHLEWSPRPERWPQSESLSNPEWSSDFHRFTNLSYGWSMPPNRIVTLRHMGDVFDRQDGGAFNALKEEIFTLIACFFRSIHAFLEHYFDIEWDTTLKLTAFRPESKARISPNESSPPSSPILWVCGMSGEERREAYESILYSPPAPLPIPGQQEEPHHRIWKKHHLPHSLSFELLTTLSKESGWKMRKVEKVLKEKHGISVFSFHLERALKEFLGSLPTE